MCKTHFCPNENRCFGGVLIVLLHTLPLTLQGGSITAHNKHPVFGRKSQEVNVYYWTFIGGDGRAEIRNVDLILRFPFLIAVATLKGGGDWNIPLGPFASHVCTHACADLFTYRFVWKVYLISKHVEGEAKPEMNPSHLPSTDTLYQMQYHKQSTVTWGMSVMVFKHVHVS